MMLFIETFYANPLLKFLVDTTMKSIVIFVVAGLLAFYFRYKSAAVRRFCLGYGNYWISHRPAVFFHTAEVGG